MARSLSLLVFFFCLFHSSFFFPVSFGFFPFLVGFSSIFLFYSVFNICKYKLTYINFLYAYRNFVCNFVYVHIQSLYACIFFTCINFVYTYIKLIYFIYAHKFIYVRVYIVL
jgi:hypothetical protein